MAKKLTNKDRQRILELFEADYTVSEIAKELDTSAKMVTTYLANCIELAYKVQTENKDKAKAVKKPTAKDLMITKSRNNKKGVSIMTKEASEFVDNYRQMNNDGGEAFQKRYNKNIFRREE